MLVLSRRIGEEILIAGDIRVTVLAVNGKRIRFGITAPSAVPVTRLELVAASGSAATPSTGRTRPNQQTRCASDEAAP